MSGAPNNTNKTWQSTQAPKKLKTPKQNSGIYEQYMLIKRGTDLF